MASCLWDEIAVQVWTVKIFLRQRFDLIQIFLFLYTYSVNVGQKHRELAVLGETPEYQPLGVALAFGNV